MVSKGRPTSVWPVPQTVMSSRGGPIHQASWVWGTRPTGTLPTQVPGLAGDVISVAAGRAHSLAVVSGVVYAWGLNDNGELGLGTGDTTDKSTPTPVPGLTGITAVAAGAFGSLALAPPDAQHPHGRLFEWGAWGSGTSDTPVEIDLSVLLSSGVELTQIAAGDQFNLALTSDGHVLAWGTGGSGQLGNGDENGRSGPTLVPGLSGVTAIAAGAEHSVAAAGDEVFAWGRGDSGQVGDGTTTGTNPSPVQVLGLPALPVGASYTAVGAGDLFSEALTSTGEVWGWGSNGSGELGVVPFGPELTPVKVSLGTIQIAAIAAGGSHTLALPTVPVGAPVFGALSPPSTTTVGGGYQYTFGAIGVGPIVYSVANDSPCGTTSPPPPPAPPGLTLDPDTGFLSGQPTQQGTFSFTIAATNTSGSTCAPVTITVDAAPFTDDTPPSPATVGVAYSYTFQAGGSGPNTYTLASGAFPDGLSLDPTTGILGGVPTTVASFTFQVQASNAEGSNTTPSITIDVVAPPPPTPPTWVANTPPPGTVGDAYNYQFVATGSPAPTYAIVGTGSLPDGLSLDTATGVVSGVPTTAGAVPFTIRAQNSGGNADVDRTIVVISPPSSGITPPDNLADPGQHLFQPVKIAYDGAGNAYEANVVHLGNFNDVAYLRVHPPGGPWGPAQVIPTFANNTVFDLDLAVNDAGDIAVAFHSFAIHVERRPAGGSWSPITSFNSPGTAGQTSGCPLEPFVDIGNDGTTVLTWTAFNSCNGNVTRWRVMAATFTPATGWPATPQVWTASPQDIHSKPAVAVADDGHAVVAFGARNGNFPPSDELWTAEWSGGAWTAPTLRSTLGSGINIMPSAHSVGNTIAVAWYRQSGTFVIVQTNGVWEASGTQLPGFAQPGPRGPGVAIGANDTISVASTALAGQFSFAVHVATRPAGGFFTDTVVSRPGVLSEDPDVDANPLGDVAAVWDENVGNRWYAVSALVPAGGSWPASPEPLTTTPSDNNTLASVVMDSGGHTLVVATPTSSGFGTEIDTRFYSRGPATPPATPPTITPASATVGESLSCVSPAFDGTPPFALSTTWFQNGVAISGASGDLVVHAEDVGQDITCQVTAVNEGGSATTQTSAPLVPLPDDADGVPAEVENAAPNGGDGNNDGIPDSHQAEVASLPNAVDGAYVTLVAPAGTSLTSVSATAVPASPPPPASALFPVGLLGFQIDNVATPSVDVHLLLPTGTATTTFFKLQNGAYVDATAAVQVNGNDVTLTLVDNGPFDTNPTTGVITDPLLPALVTNHAPVAVADSASTNEDTTLTVPSPGVLGNDTDVDSDPLTATVVDGPAHGSLTLSPTGGYTYVPAANFNGPDSFTYEANDGHTDSNIVTVTLSVTAVNDAPSFTKGADQTVLQNSGARDGHGLGDGPQRRPGRRIGSGAQLLGDEHQQRPVLGAAGRRRLRSVALHSGNGRIRLRDRLGDDPRRWRHCQWRDRHERTADIHHHRHAGEPCAGRVGGVDVDERGHRGVDHPDRYRRRR